MRLSLKRAACVLTVTGGLLASVFTPGVRAQDLFVNSPGAGGLNSDRILRFDGTTGASEGTFASGNGFQGLTFGPDGNLYVNRVNGIERFDGTTGASLGLFSAVSTTRDLAFGPDGNLYLAGFIDVLRVSGTTGASLGVFTSGSQLGNMPSLTFGPDGNLYVTGSDYFRVDRFNGTTGAFIDTFARKTTGGGSVFGLTFGPDGSLYVAGGNTVERYNGTTGASLGAFTSGGGLVAARDLAFGPDGNLYVVDGTADSILRFNGATGAFLDVFASGNGLDQPSYLAFGGAGSSGGEEVIPEPGTYALLASGLLPLAGAVLRRRRRA